MLNILLLDGAGMRYDAVHSVPASGQNLSATLVSQCLSDPMLSIQSFHAHVYFDSETVEQAQTLCQSAGETFSLTVGRMHHKPVGPHPCWSCQLAFSTEQFGNVIPWLALHRGGLTIFIHPLTGDDLKDHTDHAIWMGSIEPLQLDALR